MTVPPTSLRTRALWLLLLATAFWGLSFPLIKSMGALQAQLLPEAGTWFSSLYLVAPRFALAVVVLTALRGRDLWRVSRGELKQGGIMGLFATAGMLLQNDGLQYTSASTSAFLTQFYAILIPLWLALRMRRNPGGLVWMCCALVLTGGAILGGFDWRELRLGRGEWETLLCSVFFMGQILWLEKKEFAGNRSDRLTLVTFVVQAVVLGTLTGLAAPDVQSVLRPWTSGTWVVFTLLLTLFCTVGAYWLMNIWQPKITATEAGLIYCVEPIFASGLALFLPGWFSAWADIDYANERATWTLLVGGGLITLANGLLQSRVPKSGPEQNGPLEGTGRAAAG